MDKHFNNTRLMIDLDDVLADWDAEVKSYLNLNYSLGAKIPQIEWDKLKNHTRFYRHLPLLPGANELVCWAKDFANRNDMHLAFLTAIPKDNDMPYAIYDKMLWVQERFPGIPVFFGPYSTDKQMHCRKGDILIDDRPENCKAWRKAGGIAHQYTTWPACKVWIANTLGSKYK